MSDDDGIGGPAGPAFGAALEAAAAARGFTVSGYPRLWAPWVDEPWHGRTLTVRAGSFGARGRTTGHRWVVVRLSTHVRLGPWADVALPGQMELEGTGLILHPQPPTPRGVWADDPELGEALWALAARVAPGPPERYEDTTSWLHLQVRPDAVLWQLRASRIDATALVEALDLLERVAGYAEAHDAALSARLDRAPGVDRGRAITFVALAVTAVVLAALLGAVALSAVR